MAKELAYELGIPIQEHLPEMPPEGSPRHQYTKAFHARNTLIAQDCDVLIAVVAPDRKGGTENTVEKARTLGKRVILVEN